MATQTTNYGLTKPDVDDFYDIEEFNNTLDEIDSALGNASFITDASTGTKYRWGVDNGGVFLEEVE